jgi:hypothetical protein
MEKLLLMDASKTLIVLINSSLYLYHSAVLSLRLLSSMPVLLGLAKGFIRSIRHRQLDKLFY